MTRTQGERNVAHLGFLALSGFFVRSEQKLISRFGKERLNNIWQAQVPPRSVRPSLPQWEGNLAAPGEAVPTLRGRDSLCLWYQMNIMRSCLNTQISCKKRETWRQATCKSTCDGRWMWPARTYVLSAVTGMHAVVFTRCVQGHVLQ